MSFLDQIQQQVLGTLNQSNPSVANLLSGVLSENGGLDGLMNKFNSGEFKDLAMSWVGKGANLPISVEQINQVLGKESIQNFAQKMGIDSHAVAQQISEYLPTVIDKLTPDGQLPTAGNIASNIGSFAKNILGGLKS
jgi:uncharacterized protein YidB (DUF937 family)